MVHTNPLMDAECQVPYIFVTICLEDLASCHFSKYWATKIQQSCIVTVWYDYDVSWVKMTFAQVPKTVNMKSAITILKV